jgi:hypothetical protein
MLSIANNRINPSLLLGVKPRESSLSFEEQVLADVETPVLKPSSPDTFEQLTDDDDDKSPVPDPTTDEDYYLSEAAEYPKHNLPQKSDAEIKAQLLKDATELHEIKVSTALMTAIPVLGPIIASISTFLSNPETLAEKRLDVKTGERSVEEGIDQEAKVKKAKLKALFVTAAPQVASLGVIIAHQLVVENLLKEANVKLSDAKAVTDFLAKSIDPRVQRSHALLGLGIVLGASSFLAPIGYLFLEKPEDANFNKLL